MFFPRALGLVLISCTSAWAAPSPATSADDAAIAAQAWTGSLLAPSPASSRVGGVGMEMFFVDKRGYGSFDSGGGLHTASGPDQFRSSLSVTYGLTAQLSVQTAPAVYHARDAGIDYTGIGDVPLKLKYRFLEGRAGLFHPSFTTAWGVTLPTGDYQRLRSAKSGFGSGVYGGTGQLSMQSAFVAWDHPSRLRMWVTVTEPLTSVTVHDISSYGTAPGFVGRALPGATAQLGIGDEFALSQHWVVDLDLVEDFSRSAHLHGAAVTGPLATTHGRSMSLAPAVEYNFSQQLGLIAGAEISMMGRNANALVIPQLALNTHF